MVKPANPISIYFDGVVIDTLPTYYDSDTSVANCIYNPTKDTASKYNWYSYTKSITVTTAGNKTFNFEGTQVYAQREITITNVKLIEKLIYDETRINGALINSTTIPIINSTSMNATNQGTRFFWNTNTTQKQI